MKRALILGFCVCLSSCGGGSSEPSSAIEGTWVGDLRAGVIVCENGVSSGVGAGILIRELALEIAGTDEIGSVVQARDGDCLLEGSRTDVGFVATPVSGCEKGLVRLTFKLLGEGQAAGSIRFSNEGQELPAGQVHCSNVDSVALTR